ncbi:LAMI_0F03070g1_1 [Lachancea mirantina]|uniref:LAMI_0F03070g1_1 n=1 Tax=Lachancea mirantina TaxID=1230905 RepID=A0A1G4JWX5_9SACH|nr:LAMI_0F03070g1_1 [Lachancea mirantina]
MPFYNPIFANEFFTRFNFKPRITFNNGFAPTIHTMSTKPLIRTQTIPSSRELMDVLKSHNDSNKSTESSSPKIYNNKHHLRGKPTTLHHLPGQRNQKDEGQSTHSTQRDKFKKPELTKLVQYRALEDQTTFNDSTTIHPTNKMNQNDHTQLKYRFTRNNHNDLLKSSAIQTDKYLTGTSTKRYFTTRPIKKLKDTIQAPASSHIRDKQTKSLLLTQNSAEINLRKAYDKIKFSCDTNNPGSALIAWLEIKDLPTRKFKHDPLIIYKLIRLFTNNKAYRKHCSNLLENIDPKLYTNHAKLLPAMILFSVQTKDVSLAKKLLGEFNEISDSTNNKLFTSRFFLSTILKMHLTFNDTEGVNDDLKKIVDIHGSLSSSDYQAIIRHLLSTGKTQDFNDALKLLNTIPQQKKLLAITSLIIAVTKKLQQNSSPYGNLAKTLDHILREAHSLDSLHRHSLWDVLAAQYLKYVLTNKFKLENTTKVSNNALQDSILDYAKYLYVNSLQTQTQNSTVNPFNSSAPQNIRLKLTKKNSLTILRIIALESLKQKRSDIFSWCTQQMKRHGTNQRELKFQFNMIYKHQFRFNKYDTMEELDKQLRFHSNKDIGKFINKPKPNI